MCTPTRDPSWDWPRPVEQASPGQVVRLRGGVVQFVLMRPCYQDSGGTWYAEIVGPIGHRYTVFADRLEVVPIDEIDLSEMGEHQLHFGPTNPCAEVT